jgi:hypothetical protein
MIYFTLNRLKMTKAIKQYKELTMIQLKDWTVLNTEADPAQVADILNSQKFVVIDWVWFNSYEVKKFEKYEPNEVDWFVLWQPKEIRDSLYKEIDIRKQKWLTTNMGIIKTILDRIKQ